MKVFFAECEVGVLMRISLAIVGIVRPHNQLVMPISRRRPELHKVLDADNKVTPPWATQSLQGGKLTLGFYKSDAYRFSWCSQRGNKLVATLQPNGSYKLCIMERTDDCCVYRAILIHVGLSLTYEP